jgi:D-sedoheptulose 7-phosphate isomerase
MRSEDLIHRRFAEAAEVKRALQAPEHVDFTARAAALIGDRLRAGGQVLLCGNGGSAADATHIAAELVGRFYVDRGPLPALSLSDNASALTCISNDYDFTEVFARQVRGHGREGDVLMAYSTSGSSPNVLAAVAAAREVGMHVIGFTSAHGDDLAGAADLCLRAPSTDTPRVQEAHMLVSHTLCELVELELFGGAAPAGADADGAQRP